MSNKSAYLNFENTIHSNFPETIESPKMPLDERVAQEHGSKTEYDLEVPKVRKVLAGARVRCGVRATTLAKKIGVSAAYLSQVENGRKRLTMQLLHAIEKVIPLEEAEISELYAQASASDKSYPDALASEILTHDIVTDRQKTEWLRGFARALRNSSSSEQGIDASVAPDSSSGTDDALLVSVFTRALRQAKEISESPLAKARTESTGNTHQSAKDLAYGTPPDYQEMKDD